MPMCVENASKAPIVAVDSTNECVLLHYSSPFLREPITPNLTSDLALGL